MAELFVTRINIPEEAIEKIVSILNLDLANCATAQAMVKFAHWNVKGDGFWATHKLFDEIFELVLQMTDDIAERIGALGGICEGLPLSIAANCTLSDYTAQSPKSVVRDHIEGVANVIGELGNRFREDSKLCAAQGDTVTSDYFTQWAQDLDHKLYFLEAHLRP